MLGRRVQALVLVDKRLYMRVYCICLSVRLNALFVFCL